MQDNHRNKLVEVDIDGLGVNGEGVGSVDGKRMFIHGALPGERVKARLSEEKQTYCKGEAVEVLKWSEDRVEPPCLVFGVCGGCQLMHLSYEKQVEAKRIRVQDALERIGKLKVEVDPCRPSPKPFWYRNKIQMPVMGDGRAGLYQRGSHDVIEVKRCYIHSELGEGVFAKVRPFIQKEMRHLLIKSAVNTGEVLVVFITWKKPSKALKKIAKELVGDEVKGVVSCVNGKLGNRVLGETFEVLAGQGSIEETLCGLRFTVSPASFFQVNPYQAEHLYQKVVELAGLSGEETVLDAFCGVGTLGLICARKAKRVIGVECVPAAVEDANCNAKLNGIENATFTVGRVEEVINQVGDVDVVILNPPRKGCEIEVLEAMKAPILIYVSCDPATLSRDLRILVDRGYEVTSVTPFDMFPQTAHVETVVRCQKRKSS